MSLKYTTYLCFDENAGKTKGNIMEAKENVGNSEIKMMDNRRGKCSCALVKYAPREKLFLPHFFGFLCRLIQCSAPPIERTNKTENV